MRQLYAQLPPEYLAFRQKLLLAHKTWQLFGVSYNDLEVMDDFERDLLEIELSGSD